MEAREKMFRRVQVSEAVRTSREKRRQVLIYRGMLLVAVGGLLLSGGLAASGLASLTLVLAFGWSNVLLGFFPAKTVGNLKFALGLGGADLLLVGLGVHLAGAGAGALPVSSLLMILVVALGENRVRAVGGATTVTAMHAWFVMNLGVGPAITQQLALQVFFLLTVGLYYGFLVDGIHQARKKAQAEQLSKKELTALLEILETITSSDDLKEVPRAIVDRIGAVVPSLRCSLIKVDVERGVCLVQATHDDPGVRSLELELDKYPEIRESIWSRKPVLVRDVGTDNLMADVRKHVTPLGFNSILVVPMVVDDPDLGTVLLKTTRMEEEFSESEISFCEAVGRAAVNTMKNAILRRSLGIEVKQRKEAIEELQSVLKYSPDLILCTSLEGRITEFNRAAEGLLGYSRAQMIGAEASILFVSASAQETLDRLTERGPLKSSECIMRRKDGTEIVIEMSVSFMRSDNDELTGAVWMGTDVTPLQTAHLKLLQAEKMSTIGSVISGVAHELNNPLSVVLGFSELLLARRAGTDDEPHIEKINTAAVRCQRIVKNLLAYSRAHKPERQYSQLNDILEKTLELKEYNLRVHNIAVIKEFSPNLPRTMLDFHQMQQVFMNLLNNAQHSMEEVSGRAGRLVIRTFESGDSIMAEFSDNGQGLDSAAAATIFDPFYTTKEEGKGTGLGLSVSEGIVQEHGGRITVAGTPGVGATFTIAIPVHSQVILPADEDGLAIPEAAAKSNPKNREKNCAFSILLVDDEPTIIELLNLLLEEAGHHVDTACNGEEAWNKAQAGEYDLVITDVRMPKMNGLEFYKKLKALRPRLAENLIFVSGDLGDNATARFLAEVNATIIPKPVEVLKFVDTVEEALKNSAAVPVH
jgi:PAS domain S-box-containing protein